MKNREKYEDIDTSYVNGQRTQAKEQLKRLKKEERKECILYLKNEYGSSTDCIDFLLINL